MNRKEENPIYDFERLKRFLESRGCRVGDAIAYRPIESGDFDPNDLRNNIEFTGEGIFLKTPEGDIQQIFLYKRDYHLKYGKPPRYHICKCSTIQNFIDRGLFDKEYRRANTESVKVRNMDNGYREVIVSNLPLCQNCVDVLKGYSNMSSSDFVELLKQTKKEKTTDVDMFGYTWDWEMRSQAYREKKNYTCEKCKLQVDPYDRIFMHVHHIDGDKTNNDIKNLKCLCIRCHSRVNATHRKNFSKGGVKDLLDEFNDLYPEREV